MLTAEVLALTTSVEMQVAASTPPALVPTSTTSLIRLPSRGGPEISGRPGHARAKTLDGPHPLRASSPTGGSVPAAP